MEKSNQTDVKSIDGAVEEMARVYVGRFPERKAVQLFINLEYGGARYGTVSVCPLSAERDCWKGLAQGSGKTLKSKGAKRYELSNGQSFKTENCLPLDEDLLRVVNSGLSEALNGYTAVN